MKTLLAVDLSNILYKAVATHQVLKHAGEFTGGLYGFLVSVSKAINKVEATDILFCRDMRPYIRCTEYPQYKEDRQKTRDEDIYAKFVESMTQMVALCGNMGWPLWGIQGFESDDLIAKCVLSRKWRRVVAMSNDSDLYQLLDFHSFGIYKSAAEPIYNYEQFFDEWQMTTRDYKLALAMMGTHNEIRGIAGIGKVTVKQVLRNPHEYRRIREKHAELIDRNLHLIELPHPKFPTDLPPPSSKFPFNYRNLIRHLAPYDIDVTASMMKAFERLSAGV